MHAIAGSCLFPRRLYSSMKWPGAEPSPPTTKQRLSNPLISELFSSHHITTPTNNQNNQNHHHHRHLPSAHPSTDIPASTSFIFILSSSALSHKESPIHHDEFSQQKQTEPRCSTKTAQRIGSQTRGEQEIFNVSQPSQETTFEDEMLIKLGKPSTITEGKNWRRRSSQKNQSSKSFGLINSLSKTMKSRHDKRDKQHLDRERLGESVR